MSDRDYQHSRILDVHRWSDHPEANKFVDEIYASFLNNNLMDQKQTTVQPQAVVNQQVGADVCAKYRNNEGAYSSCQRGVAQKNADEQRRLENEAYNEGLKR
jgi:hypothetical protein